MKKQTKKQKTARKPRPTMAEIKQKMLEDAEREVSSKFEDISYKRRRAISKMLGSTKKTYFNNNTEVNVLEWDEIYFELGRLIEKVGFYQKVQNLESQIEEIKALNNISGVNTERKDDAKHIF